ncbi:MULTISPECIES: DNA polymerase III subunit beta [unclassified Candidatus Frackibacter]|uniref:DNA polymerase III subunit beta n=1 Tax=unclassified Candidatus Frackibacter TaxID=2648818 RepID=UPI000891CD28|nr:MULTISPECIES: DNA polymerase III subunit beta [unclassified Candidatus Frackibacter]SDC43596.1 DNA polymerase III, beta subunit [Candidatus Frackibacter sp. WG11]SEM64007.1 DNA polymerase III, beta subunit [Candidatus Frackibacter sp. WG12]SFL68802.1 DNA polymerase III, beta subunit [Candidatus Frackibacter sp. WG13]
MQIKVNKKELYEGIQIVSKAVSSKSTLPILSGILIKTVNDKLKLVGTDLEIGIECNVNAKIISNGSTVLPANYLTSIIRELPNQELELKVNEENNAKIICDLSEFKINGFPADEFPLLPEIESGTEYLLKQKNLKTMIDRIKFATSNDESRPFLTGGLLLVEDQLLKMVATDSYRLSYTELNLDKELSDNKVIIPSKTLDELSKLLSSEEEKEVQILTTDNQMLFDFSGITIISRLIEGNFPNYNQVIPNNFSTQVTVKRKDLLNATKRASLFVKDNSNIIRTKFEDSRLIIESTSSKVGESYEELEIEQQGDNTEIAFNANYLMDVLKVIDSEEVLLELSGKLSPGVIKEMKSDEYIYVIMPVRSA